MHKLLTRLSMLSACAALGIGAGGCTSATTPTTTNNGGPATALKVDALANNSIGAQWTRDAGDVGTDTLVGVPSDGSATQTTVAASGTGAAMLMSLKSGITYAISVHAPGGVSLPVTWAVADRSAMIRIYETGDPSKTDPSGLSLITGAVQALPTSVSSGDAAKIDMVLASDNTVAGSNLSFVSSGVQGSGLGARPTVFNDVTVSVVGGLDADYYSSDFSSLFAAQNNSYDIPATTDTHDEIIRVKTVDNHYARVDIVRQSNGLLYGTTAGGSKYIDVMVSDQGTAQFPYAGRGIDLKTFFSQKRSAGSYNAN